VIFRRARCRCDAGIDDSLTGSIPQPPLPPESLTRSYTSLSQASTEAVNARVFTRIHFRDGCERGVKQGERVGRFVFGNNMGPVN
jgi:hypothetical protein